MPAAELRLAQWLPVLADKRLLALSRDPLGMGHDALTDMPEPAAANGISSITAASRARTPHLHLRSSSDPAVEESTDRRLGRGPCSATGHAR